MTDRQQLARYVSDGSQTAFTQMVERHVRLVYATCYRELHHRELAEEATQCVFLALAKNAHALRSDADLVSWLYTTARYSASVLRRQEQRHMAKVQLATEDMVRRYERTQEQAWESIEPALNDCLSALSAPDRQAILLRFFDEMSLREVASAMGTNEDAARKRVSRALEKLRMALVTRKAAAISTVALAGLLTDRAVYAVPARIAATITHSASAMTGLPSSSPPLLGAGGLRGGFPLNSLLAKGLLIVSTTKIAAGAAAVILILAIIAVAVHHARTAVSAVPPGLVNEAFMKTASLSDPLPVLWQAPPLSDQATEQALATGIWRFRDADEGNKPAEFAQILSPDFAITDAQTLRIFRGPGDTSAIHYDEFMRLASSRSGPSPKDTGHPFRQDYRRPQIVTSCNVAGGTATIIFKAAGKGSPPVTFTFANTGSKWLITSVAFGRG